MKTTLITLTMLAVTAAATAQGGLQTASNYLVFANAGQGDLAGVPAGTAIPPRGLAIRATDRDPSSGAAAVASTAVSLLSPSLTAGGVVQVHESGNAAVRGRGRAGAGTANARPPVPAPHALGWAVPARQGTPGTVVVSWTARASDSSSTGVAVDVDGDGQADFTARMSGSRGQKQQSFSVTAGARGFRIGIVTSGRTASNGGAEGYDAALAVALRVGSGGPQCTFSAFGPECGGKLTGSLARTPAGPAVAIDLSGAAPNAVAALVVGDPLRVPIQLPGSRCQVLVAPRALAPGRTDGNGDASWRFPLRIGQRGDVSFQAVTLALRGGTAQLGSSNGVTLSCQ